MTEKGQEKRAMGGTEGKKAERKKRKSSEVLTSLFIRIYRVQESKRWGMGVEKDKTDSS